MKLSRVNNGRLRLVNSSGCYMVTPEEFRQVGWNNDVARWARIGEEILKVAVTNGEVWGRWNDDEVVD